MRELLNLNFTNINETFSNVLKSPGSNCHNFIFFYNVQLKYFGTEVSVHVLYLSFMAGTIAHRFVNNRVKFLCM